MDSIEVITRLRKLGISDYDIASTLGLSVSQRLVRRLCPKCARERDFSDMEKEQITKFLDKYGIEEKIDNRKTYDAVGCPDCNHTGYYGRIAVFELLEITEELKELIVSGYSTIEIRKKAIENGYRPFSVDGIKKVLDGVTTLTELNNKLLIF